MASTHYLPSPFENIYLGMTSDSLQILRPAIIRVHSLVETSYSEYTEELNTDINSAYYYIDPNNTMLNIVKLVYTDSEPLKKFLDQRFNYDDNRRTFTSVSNPNVFARRERNNLLIQFEKNEINPNNQ